MKPKVRMIVALAFLPLLVGLMIGYTINTSEAQLLKPTSPDVKRLSPKSYGSANSMICGDRLCSEPASGITPAFDVEENDRVEFIDQFDENTPTAKLMHIAKYRQSTNKADAVTFIVTFSVTAGKTDLKNIAIHASSDMDSLDMNIESLTALKTSVNVLRIKALDSDSIDGGITGYQLAPPTFDERNPNR